MITRFVSELNFARVPSSEGGLGGAFSWASSVRAIAQSKIVGQVGNLRPIGNRPLTGTGKLSTASTRRLPIGGRLTTCPTIRFLTCDTEFDTNRFLTYGTKFDINSFLTCSTKF